MCRFQNLDDPDPRFIICRTFVTPGQYGPHFEFLKKLAYTRVMTENIPQEQKRTSERLEYELGVVHKMASSITSLIVSDYVRYAKSVGIPVGPGRGSGAGSMVAYCIDITNIEPLKYNLLFERFLNPPRTCFMPDFDVDFCVERRQK